MTSQHGAPRNPSSGPGPETTVSSNGVTRWEGIGQGRFGSFPERGYPKSSKSLDHLVLKLVWGICTWRIIPLSKWLIWNLILGVSSHSESGL